MGDKSFSWSSKKQHIVILSTCECEVEYMVACSCVCQAIAYMVKESFGEAQHATKWVHGDILITSPLWFW